MITASPCFAAERLTTPHLASNTYEQELVRARGGTITAPGGPGESHRVDGLIEVTRALGDVWIKDKISCDPDICSFDLAPEDKLLILATDGLWDTVNASQAVRTPALLSAQTSLLSSGTVKRPTSQEGSPGTPGLNCDPNQCPWQSDAEQLLS